MLTDRIPAQGALDIVSLGALVHRLDPGVVPFRKATQCQIHVSGGEFNVAANLADAFGMKAGIVSAMVDYPIGDLVAERVRGLGVTAFYRRFSHDGVSGPNIATVYSDRGYGVRAPVVFYNRAHEAAALLKPGDVDWQSVFAGGVRWFHSGGIFAALSETSGELIIEGMQAARAAGAVVSFDLNFREKLWSLWGGRDKAAAVLERIVEHVDVLFGNVDLLLGDRREASDAKLEPASVFSTIEQVAAKYPGLKSVASTLREVHSTNRHSWSALAWLDGKRYTSPSCELDVLDRVGSGDGFTAGYVYGLLSGASGQDSLDLGWAHGALLTTFPGDTSMATLSQVRAFASGGSARIQR
jgi:2-dehydro-3-deoxygluconokinase